MTAEDVAALVAGSPFGARFAQGAPFIVAAGRPARVAFATAAALALFKVTTIEALETIAFAGRSPGAARLRHLVEALPADGRPRLESLRFYADRLPLPVGLLCARFAPSRGGDFLVLAAPHAPGAAEPAAPREAEPPPPPNSQTAVGEPAPAKAVSHRRFLWSLDADDRFGPADRALEDTVGRNTPKPGEPLAAFAARAGLERGDEFAAAVAGRATFSALRLAWPEPGRAHARIALVSGAPIFDKARQFAGFRGFGLFTDETIPCEETAAEPSDNVDEVDAAPLAALEDVPALLRAGPLATGERGAEIVLLRQPGHGQAAGPNVVPIRPGALNALPAPAEETRRDERDSVELTSHERDAFREIARALGARLPSPREEKPALDTADANAAAQAGARDLIDLASPLAADLARGDLCAVLDRLPIGAMVLRGGEALYLNQTLLDLVGFRDLAEFRAGDGLARMFRGRDAETLAEASASGAIPLVAAGGELITVDSHVQPIQWDDWPATLIALRRSHDAERHEETRALQRETRDLAAALEAAADAVIGLDANGRIVSLSRAAEALFGYAQEEIAGESFLVLFSPQSQGAAAARLEHVKAEGGPEPARSGEELIGRERRGQPIFVQLAMARLSSPQSPARYCALIRDLTPWKTIERTLEAERARAEQTSARKTDFLARVSHEVRTPLHAILGFAEVIMDERFGAIGNDRYKDYVKDIHASASHVMSLANDLLDLAKIEAGKMELEFAPVDANRIVRECVSLMQPQAAQERIIMRLSLFDKLPAVMADERSLRQILLNLMSNAVKFNEPGGQVIVSTAVDESGHPVIRVRDTGVGMNENEITAALEPFRQVGSARRAGGAGLGLPLTKALAEANHADFSIKSRKEQGTLVEVAFPSVAAAQ